MTSRIELSERINQLSNSLKIISAALSRFSGENKEEIIILASQIRALICIGGSNFHPLLIELSREFNFPLKCYGSYCIDDGPDFLMEATMFFRPVIIGIEKYSPFAVEYDLEKWVDSKIIILEKEVYKPNEIIRLKADKEASHYDSESSERLKNLKNIIYSKGGTDISLVDEYILQTAKTVCFLGNNFLGHLKSLDSVTKCIKHQDGGDAHQNKCEPDKYF